MSRCFDEKDKKILNLKIYEAGQMLFQEIGFAKTTIDRIVNKVGIGKGSFYTFYPNKEELFMTILLDIEKEKDQYFFNNLKIECESMDFVKAYKEAFLAAFMEIETDSFLRLTFDTELMKKIWSRISPDLQKASFDNDIGKFQKLAEFASDSGYDVALSHDVFSGTMRTLVFSLLNREITGPTYSEVRVILINATINILFRKKP
jgi:AcrR family transcriptional regulator